MRSNLPRPDMRIPILMYHQVDELSHPKEPMRGMVVSPSAFEAHMHTLRRLGFHGLSLAELEPYVQGQKTSRAKLCAITFDDGYRNNLTHALPLLRALGFSATCYVVSQKIGQTNAWDQPEGVVGKPLMNAQELRQWMSAGQDIGSHSATHASLPSCSAAALAEEVAGSRQQLQTQFGSDAARHFCYPYGHHNTAVVQAVREAGYTSATTTVRARAVWGADDALTLPRVLVSRTTGRIMLAAKLITAYEDRRRGRG
jgi:peptidoglycan/xylan/chitin deacetylase (PgdA/CDA1 family)